MSTNGQRGPLNTSRELEASNNSNSTHSTNRTTGILDSVASTAHSESIIDIGRIPSINFALDDIFQYENWPIPGLEGKLVWVFKIIIDRFGRAEIRLRKTGDLSNVTALSYTWGESPLTQRYIGFYIGDKLSSENDCKIILGTEWSTDDFVSTLARLSADSWLWMDQIAKRPGMTTDSTISIFSSVYSRCSVVVLLPKPMCRHINELRARLLSVRSLNYQTAMEFTKLFSSHFIECACFISNARWFTRVWTRQEALYARRIRVVHVGNEIEPCTPHNLINLEIMTRIRPALSNLGEVLSTKMNSPDEPTETSAILVTKVAIAMATFLLGIQQVCANNSPTLSRSLSRLAETNRKTTEPKDLILSVWPGTIFSMPIIDWRSAFASALHHYEFYYQSKFPCAIPQGATDESPLDSLAESSLGELAELRPSLRSLYSRFQYRQSGVSLNERGACYLRVSDELVTARSFPLLDELLTAIQFVADFTRGLPAWLIQAWWRNVLNALHDEESESLEAYGSETAVLLGVLTTRLYDSQNAGRALNETEIMDIADAFSGGTISSDRMSGLLVMCSTGAWGKDPRHLAPFACIATIESYEFISVGHPGTYRMAFGAGAGAYGCVVTESRKAYVKLLIPVPISAPPTRLQSYQVLGHD